MDQNRFLEFDVTRRIYAIKCFSYVHYRTSKSEDGISGVKIALDNETCIRVLGKNFRTKGKKEDETRKQNILGKTSFFNNNVTTSKNQKNAVVAEKIH